MGMDSRMTKARTKHCADCAKAITAKSTRCHPCSTRHINARPDVVAKREAGIKASFADPMRRARAAATMRQNAAKANANPALRAWRVQNGKELAQHALRTPQARAAYLASRPIAEAKRIETMLGWCPLEYRDEYRRLTRSKRIPRLEARQLVLDMVAADKARAEREMSPFERQMRALERGATIVANDSVSKHSLAATELRQKLA